jgi:hypothetical protein
MAGMSRSEQYTAIAVGIGMSFLFDHFRLIPPSYLSGRLASKAALVFGAGLVILIWPFIVRKKKKNDSAHKS